MRFVLVRLCLFLILIGAPVLAWAHPHVWITARTEVQFAPDGTLTGLRHAWTFDDAFSAFAVQGLDTNKDGKYSREELAELATVNVTSLKEFDFFTIARLDGKKVTLKDPVDYYLEHADGKLTLHFTLPLEAPRKFTTLSFDVNDNTLFVSFALAESTPATLSGAPSGCKAGVERPKPIDPNQSQRLGEAFFQSLEAGSSYAAQFANKITVTCP